MDALVELIQQNVAIAPYLIFALLLLAGLNLPVSEDIMLFISAILAKDDPSRWPIFFIAVTAGAYISDLMVYFMGRVLGPKLQNIKWFASMLRPEIIAKVSTFYEKYGIFTLIFGRFIPFGVRNGLFLSAGLGRMNPWKFAISDGIACLISCSTYFYLYYTFGPAMIEIIKKSNIVIFSIALFIALALIIKKKRSKKMS